MTTPAPTPAGPTTIPEPTRQLIEELLRLLARERRRYEALVKALREIALHDTVDAPCEHLTSEGCRAWIEETAEEALKDAAKALQGQDGAK
jgi:hypothetical protein